MSAADRHSPEHGPLRRQVPRRGDRPGVRAAAGSIGVSAPTVAKSFEHMRQLGMLREITGRQRHRLFVNDAYLAILSEGTEPIR